MSLGRGSSPMLELLARWALALTLLALAPFAAVGADNYPAGFMDLALTDPVEGGPMRGFVVYPAATQGPPSQLDLFTIEATAGAPPSSGSFPLIVVSHGTGGSLLTHHDSMSALARAGFVIASVEHPRDNFRDDSGFGTDLQLIGRAHHIVALIDGVLAHAKIGGMVDRSRIGMSGHSAGGYTALLVAGAVPNFALMEEYRKAVPFDFYRARADKVSNFRRKPGLDVVADPRVRAIFVMAPALGYVFDRNGLSKVEIPVRLYRPSADELLPHPWDAERIATMLPRQPEYQVLQGAGHFVFLAPCSAAFAARVPIICADPPGIDRVSIHRRLNDEMIDFFRRALQVK
jgi:predicted dienelactone hydrolase